MIFNLFMILLVCNPWALNKTQNFISVSIPVFCLSNKTLTKSRIRQEEVILHFQVTIYDRNKSGEEPKQELEVETMVDYYLLTPLFHLDSCLISFLIPPMTTIPGYDAIHSGLGISTSINYQKNAPQMCI